MKLLTAKFSSKCHKTGAKINKGELMYYDYRERKIYCKKYIDDFNEAYNIKQFIEAQETCECVDFLSEEFVEED